jgi:hypothetical protein
LDYLSDKYGVTIRIDPAAFARFGVTKPYEIEDQLVRVMAGRNLTSADVLREVLAQVPPIGTEELSITYAVKGARIAIVPEYKIPYARTLAKESEETPLISYFMLENQVEGGPTSLDCTNQPLIDVLRELADDTGANIVLDDRAKEKGQTPVTVSLQNVRLFTALRVIADMADLQPTTIGNVYYVTTKENADRLHRQEWLKRPAGSPAGSAATSSPKPGGK